MIGKFNAQMLSNMFQPPCVKHQNGTLVEGVPLIICNKKDTAKMIVLEIVSYVRPP